MFGSERARRLLPPMLVLASLAAALLLLRSGSGVGWGGASRLRGSGAAIGLLANAEDNLSYAAWAQQARQGAWRFSDLYTTEPHHALLVNPFFLFLGLASRATGWTPLLLLNGCGLLAAIAAVALVHRAALIAGLSPGAGTWAAFLTAFGGGLSWMPIPRPIEGADLRYPDLVPATAFAVFPYQAVGIALSALLLVTILAAEREAEAAPLSPSRVVGLALATLLLAASRPYEPVALAAAVSAHALAGLFRNGPRKLKRRRLAIAATVALCVTPFVLYGIWVARQPVWSFFAEHSLDLKAPSRTFWLLGFGVLLPASFAGALRVTRSAPARARMIVAWGGLVALLLLVMNTQVSKLAGAGFVALSLLAGEAVASLFASRSALRAGLAVMLLAAAVPAPLVFARRSMDAPPVVDPAWPAAASVIASRSGSRPVVVLTTPRAGVFLPGWAGARVYAGHWSLSGPDRERHVEELRACGLGDPGSPPGGFVPGALEALVAKVSAEFVLAPAASPAGAALSSDQRARPLLRTPEWILFEVGKEKR